jgi:hypothetical protein
MTYSVFFLHICMVYWFYPNQQLICLQNIPNLSTMWKCGLDMLVTTGLKNDLFSAFSYWSGFIQTNNYYVCKIFLIYQLCGDVFSTCRWQLLWEMTYLVFFSYWQFGVDLSKPTNMFAKYSLFMNYVKMWSRHVGDNCFEKWPI